MKGTKYIVFAIFLLVYAQVRNAYWGDEWRTPIYIFFIIGALIFSIVGMATKEDD